MQARYHPPPPKTEPAKPQRIPVTFRAVNLQRQGDKSANSRLMYAVADAICASALVDKAESGLVGRMELEEDEQKTFTFQMVLRLQPPGWEQLAANKK
jgi:hypothetical protein